MTPDDISLLDEIGRLNGLLKTAFEHAITREKEIERLEKIRRAASDYMIWRTDSKALALRQALENCALTHPAPKGDCAIHEGDHAKGPYCLRWKGVAP